MSKTPVSPLRDRWARLRFSIIGPLLAAPPLPQQLHAALAELSARTWRNRLRADRGRFPSLMPQVIETLTLQYREHPGWSVQLHYDNLRVALSGSAAQLPSYPTIRRYLLAQGMFRRATPYRATTSALAARDRLERLEVRSFEVEHVGALWHLNFHHGSRRVLTRAGAWDRA